MSLITVRFVHYPTHVPILLEIQLEPSKTVKELMSLVQKRLVEDEQVLMRTFSKWYIQKHDGEKERHIELSDSDAEKKMSDVGIDDQSIIYLEGPLYGGQAEQQKGIFVFESPKDTPPTSGGNTASKLNSTATPFVPPSTNPTIHPDSTTASAVLSPNTGGPPGSSSFFVTSTTTSPPTSGTTGKEKDKEGSRKNNINKKEELTLPVGANGEKLLGRDALQSLPKPLKKQREAAAAAAAAAATNSITQPAPLSSIFPHGMGLVPAQNGGYVPANLMNPMNPTPSADFMAQLADATAPFDPTKLPATFNTFMPPMPLSGGGLPFAGIVPPTAAAAGLLGLQGFVPAPSVMQPPGVPPFYASMAPSYTPHQIHSRGSNVHSEALKGVTDLVSYYNGVLYTDEFGRQTGFAEPSAGSAGLLTTTVAKPLVDDEDVIAEVMRDIPSNADAPSSGSHAITSPTAPEAPRSNPFPFLWQNDVQKQDDVIGGIAPKSRTRAAEDSDLESDSVSWNAAEGDEMIDEHHDTKLTTDHEPLSSGLPLSGEAISCPTSGEPISSKPISDDITIIVAANEEDVKSNKHHQDPLRLHSEANSDPSLPLPKYNFEMKVCNMAFERAHFAYNDLDYLFKYISDHLLERYAYETYDGSHAPSSGGSQHRNIMGKSEHPSHWNPAAAVPPKQFKPSQPIPGTTSLRPTALAGEKLYCRVVGMSPKDALLSHDGKPAKQRFFTVETNCATLNEILHRGDVMFLADRNGFHVCHPDPESCEKFKNYCSELRRSSQKKRHATTQGFPSTPLQFDIVQVSTTASNPSAGMQAVPPPFLNPMPLFPQMPMIPTTMPIAVAAALPLLPTFDPFSHNSFIPSPPISGISAAGQHAIGFKNASQFAAEEVPTGFEVLPLSSKRKSVSEASLPFQQSKKEAEAPVSDSGSVGFEIRPHTVAYSSEASPAMSPPTSGPKKSNTAFETEPTIAPYIDPAVVAMSAPPSGTHPSTAIKSSSVIPPSNPASAFFNPFAQPPVSQPPRVSPPASGNKGGYRKHNREIPNSGKNVHDAEMKDVCDFVPYDGSAAKIGKSATVPSAKGSDSQEWLHSTAHTAPSATEERINDEVKQDTTPQTTTEKQTNGTAKVAEGVASTIANNEKTKESTTTLSVTATPFNPLAAAQATAAAASKEPVMAHIDPNRIFRFRMKVCNMAFVRVNSALEDLKALFDYIAKVILVRYQVFTTTTSKPVVPDCRVIRMDHNDTPYLNQWPSKQRFFVVETNCQNLNEVLHRHDVMFLADRHGFQSCRPDEESMTAFVKYCTAMRTMSQENRHVKMEGLPSMPLQFDLCGNPPGSAPTSGSGATATHHHPFPQHGGQTGGVSEMLGGGMPFGESPYGALPFGYHQTGFDDFQSQPPYLPYVATGSYQQPPYSAPVGRAGAGGPARGGFYYNGSMNYTKPQGGFVVTSSEFTAPRSHPPTKK